MENLKEKINLAESKVLAARTNLRAAQNDAMAVFREIIAEMENVTFKPSPLRKADIDSGQEHALANALDEEGVAPITFTDRNGAPKQGCIHSISVDKDGYITIRVQEMREEELVDIAADDTWDADLLLEFVRMFGAS